MKRWIRRLENWGMAILGVLALLHAASYSSAQGNRQKAFTSPKAAVAAVTKACQANDTAALLDIFGPDGKDIVVSGDPSDDKDGRAAFVRLVKEKMKLIPDPANADRMILSIGKQDWPFPVPLVHRDNEWTFDSAQGRQEILARRVGSNELNAIEVNRAYVEAQYEYANSHKVKGVPEYAQKINSTPGKQDGLYWEAKPGTPECPVPAGFAKAAAGMSLENREPYRGYYFRILTAQGPKAQGGAANYVVNGSMIGGFALVAWPAEYGVSGVQTFMVNHDGVVYEANLGAETPRIATEKTEFNPDPSTWHPVQSPS